MRPGHGGEIATQQGGAVDSGIIDFSVNLNEALSELPDELWLSWKKSITQYPPPIALDVEERLAKLLRIETPHLICVNGGTIALEQALACSQPEEVIIPTPCFSEYTHLCQQQNKTFKEHRVAPEKWSAPHAWLPEEPEPGQCILLANPNNPTGTLLPLPLLSEKISASAAKNVTWIVDEAFIEFTSKNDQHSLLRVLDQHSNLIVAGSLTKTWNIPGLRLGYIATSNEAWLGTIRAKQTTWPLNGLVFPWAKSFLNKDTWKQNKQTLIQIRTWKDAFQTQLSKEQPLLRPLPSDSNYFLCEIDAAKISPIRLAEKLLEKGINIRLCDNIPGMPQGKYIRLAVRGPLDNQFLTNSIKEISCSL